MQNNLEAWKKLERPPEWALKRITGGRLSGKTDINPQWRYLAMTEVFGPVGIGWTFKINRVWREDGHGGEVFAFAEVAVSAKFGDKWSEPITAIGGSMLVEQERAGLHNNDEAYKMAVTDALGTALKFLGVAAQVYQGFNDGSKYIKPEAAPEKPPDAPKPKASFADEMKKQKERLGDTFELILTGFGVEKVEEITDKEKQIEIYKAMIKTEVI